MATPMQGDYLMWALAPDVPVTYSHMHLFHPDYWEELAVVGQGRPGWRDVIEKYRVNLIIVEAQYWPEVARTTAEVQGVDDRARRNGRPEEADSVNAATNRDPQSAAVETKETNHRGTETQRRD